MTSMKLAIQMNSPTVVQYLIDKKGIDVNEGLGELSDHNMRFQNAPPLLFAIKYNSMQVMDVLLFNGANVHYAQEMPLRYSITKNEPEIVKKLINHGANLRWVSPVKNKSLIAIYQEDEQRTSKYFDITKILVVYTWFAYSDEFETLWKTDVNEIAFLKRFLQNNTTSESTPEEMLQKLANVSQAEAIRSQIEYALKQKEIESKRAQEELRKKFEEREKEYEQARQKFLERQTKEQIVQQYKQHVATRPPITGIEETLQRAQLEDVEERQRGYIFHRQSQKQAQKSARKKWFVSKDGSRYASVGAQYRHCNTFVSWQNKQYFRDPLTGNFYEVTPLRVIRLYSVDMKNEKDGEYYCFEVVGMFYYLDNMRAKGWPLYNPIDESVIFDEEFGKIKAKAKLNEFELPEKLPQRLESQLQTLLPTYTPPPYLYSNVLDDDEELVELEQRIQVLKQE